MFLALTRAAVAQLVARSSHNSKIPTSILTCRRLYAIAAAPTGVLLGAKAPRLRLRASNCVSAAGVWQRGSLLAVSGFSDTEGGGGADGFNWLVLCSWL